MSGYKQGVQPTPMRAISTIEDVSRLRQLFIRSVEIVNYLK